MSKKTYMILGGAGVLGTQFIRHLLLNNPDVFVVCVGRSPEKPTPFLLHRGIDDARYVYYQIHIVHGSQRLLELFDTVKPSVIVNFAAQSESSASWESSWRFFETNNVALAKIVEPLIGIAWFKHWIQIGSSEIYGETSKPATEESALVPVTPYSASKVAADLYLLSLARTWNFPVTILRPSGVYGPGQGLHRIIPKAIFCALTGQKFPLEGGGATEKYLLHAEDLSRAICLVIDQKKAGTVYNVGPKEGISMRALVEMIAEKTRIPFHQLVKMVPNRPGQEKKYLLDGSRLMRECGWQPKIGLTEGIDTVIEWEKKYLSFLRQQPTKYQLQD